MRAGMAILTLAFGGLACQAEKTVESVPERPNILFLFTDDQRADALGA